MVKEADSPQSPEAISEPVFTPEIFLPQWKGDPVDILDIPLNFPYSSEEWDQIFGRVLSLLNHEGGDIRYRAIKHLVRALEMVDSQRSNDDAYQPRPTDERLHDIFEVIATQSQSQPKIFENFCFSLKYWLEQSPHNPLVLEWLDHLATSEERQTPTAEEITAAKIFLGAYDSTWQDVGLTLLDLLDHEDLTIRACAAYQIGKFYEKAFSTREEAWWRKPDSEKDAQDKQAVIGLPAIEVMMQLMASKEVERPGIAGAFWEVVPKQGIEAKEWLLDILERSPEPEPYLPYFPCNLAFDAHERFSADADAVRRLIDMGRKWIALEAATDHPSRIVILEPLLIELGNEDEPEFIRIASWHLAYFYHYLHPQGARFGYVEQIDKLLEIDLFLLFQRQEMETPYAVVIYPKEKHQKLHRTVAQKWVDRIFPEAVRGTPRKDLRLLDDWYQRGYIQHCTSAQDTTSDLVENTIIGYRSALPWNPKQFLP